MLFFFWEYEWFEAEFVDFIDEITSVESCVESKAVAFDFLMSSCIALTSFWCVVNACTISLLSTMLVNETPCCFLVDS